MLYLALYCSPFLGSVENMTIIKLRRSFFSILLLALSASAAATETVTITLEFEPDLNNGRHIYQTCATCHLPEGWGDDEGTYPQIAGQLQNVLIKQLLDIRSGERDNPLMYPFVQKRTLGGYQDMADVVAYIATLPMHPKHKQGPWRDYSDEYKQGKALYTANCSACHGSEGEGNNTASIPKLYGQHYPYLKRQLLDIKAGHRQASAGMKAMVDPLSRKQLEMTINYVSYLPVPENEKAPSLNWRNTDFL